MKVTRGFTLIEVILVLGIFAILFGIATVTLLRPQNKFSTDTAVATLISDLKEQQVKAMAGDSEDQTQAQDFGVHFENSPQNRYILFRGTTYNLADTSNFVIALKSPVTFTGTLPLNVIFQRRSGEIGTQATITVRNSESGDQKVITINRLGGVVVN